MLILLFIKNGFNGKLWEVEDWGSKIVGGGRLRSKFVGGGRLGVKICGKWEIGTPVSSPPPRGTCKYYLMNVTYTIYCNECWVMSSKPKSSNKQVQYVALRKQQKRPGSRFFKEIGRNEICTVVN